MINFDFLSYLQMTTIKITNGGIKYYYNKKLHRTDGPAVIYDGWGQVWYLYGHLHREDGYTIERIDNINHWFIDDIQISNKPDRWHDRMEWALDGKIHRLHGPAVEYYDGRKEWMQYGLRHREDGPAIEYYDGRKEWIQYGFRHREDGPAIEYHNGDKVYYLCGIEYTYEEYLKLLKL